MTAESAVQEALLFDPIIASLVSVRVYPQEQQPQAGTFPAITYQRISTTTRIDLDREEEPTRVRLQLNCIAATYKAAMELAMEIRRLFRGGYATTGVQLVRVDSQSDLPRDPETRQLGVRIDLFVTMGAAEAA